MYTKEALIEKFNKIVEDGIYRSKDYKMISRKGHTSHFCLIFKLSDDVSQGWEKPVVSMKPITKKQESSMKSGIVKDFKARFRERFDGRRRWFIKDGYYFKKTKDQLIKKPITELSVEEIKDKNYHKI